MQNNVISTLIFRGPTYACASCSSQEGGKLDYFVPQFYFLIYMLSYKWSQNNSA